jgi:hypothetical protein
MQIDKALADLAAKLDAWFDGSSDTFASEDRSAQAKTIIRGVAIVNELDRVRNEGLATLSQLINRRDAATDGERTETLVRGFEFGAKLRHALHDELLDTDGETKVAHSMHAIVKALDEMSSGRVVLAELLDHSDPGVRVSVGAYLIDMMPDRVVPVLRQIEESNQGTSAGFSAHWVLLDRELKQQKRGLNGR